MPRISKRIKNFEITAENNIIQISNIKSYLVDANPNYEYTFSYEFPDKGMGGKTRTRAYNLDHFNMSVFKKEKDLAEDDSVSIVKYSPNRIELRTDSKQHTFLVLSELCEL